MGCDAGHSHCPTGVSQAFYAVSRIASEGLTSLSRFFKTVKIINCSNRKFVIAVYLLSRVWLFVTAYPCPSPTPGVHSNSRPLSQWCHPTISSSMIPFFSCLQSFPASGSFQMSQLFASGGQRIGFQHQSFQWPCTSMWWRWLLSLNPVNLPLLGSNSSWQLSYLSQPQ